MAKATVLVLVTGMLLTGTLNTILLKYQGLQCLEASRHGHGASRGCASFPIWQSFVMFLGEALCLLVGAALKMLLWLRRDRASSAYAPVSVVETLSDEDDPLADSVLLAGLQPTSPNPPLEGTKTFALALPALLDILATTTMSVGLLLTTASTFQMLRGSLVLFVGFFSVVFLKRRLLLHQWTALALVTLGVFLVGLSSLSGTRRQDEAKNALLGVCLITGAQLFSASQFVLEEFILSRYAIEPLKMVGFEGIFGVILTTTSMVLAYVFYGSGHGQGGTFDIVAGAGTILSSSNLLLAFTLFAVSIASFNFFGLSVTHTVSATSRSTIDACRTLFIWAVSLALGWEHFKWLQLVGFAVLVYATLLFNGVIAAPAMLRREEVDA